jgi:hypothetical protein
LFDLLWYSPTTSDSSRISPTHTPSWSWGAVNSTIRSAVIDLLLPNTAEPYSTPAKISPALWTALPALAGSGCLLEANIIDHIVSWSTSGYGTEQASCLMFLDHSISSNTSNHFFLLLVTIQYCGGLLLCTTGTIGIYERVGFARCGSSVIDSLKKSADWRVLLEQKLKIL